MLAAFVTDGIERAVEQARALEPTRVLGSDEVTHVRYRVSGG